MKIKSITISVVTSLFLLIATPGKAQEMVTADTAGTLSKQQEIEARKKLYEERRVARLQAKEEARAAKLAAKEARYQEEEALEEAKIAERLVKLEQKAIRRQERKNSKAVPPPAEVTTK